MRMFKSYTKEQRTMKDKGFTLCIECQKGFKGDKTCGANGHIDYNNESASGCNCGKQIKTGSEFSSSPDELSSFFKKAMKKHSKMIDIELSIKGQCILDLEPLFNDGIEYSTCPKSVINSYAETHLPDFENELKDFINKLKAKGILILEIKGVQKEFDPFAQAIELIKKGII